MRNFSILMATSLLISSCYSLRDAERDLDKAKQYYPDVVAQRTRDWFPCNTGSDTSIRTEYDFIEIACPGVDSVTKLDTIILTKTKNPRSIFIEKQKIVGIPSETKYITKVVRDSAQIYSLETRVKGCAEELKHYMGKAERRGQINLWLIILLTISMLLNVLKIRK